MHSILRWPPQKGSEYSRRLGGKGGHSSEIDPSLPSMC